MDVKVSLWKTQTDAFFEPLTANKISSQASAAPWNWEPAINRKPYVWPHLNSFTTIFTPNFTLNLILHFLVPLLFFLLYHYSLWINTFLDANQGILWKLHHSIHLSSYLKLYKIFNHEKRSFSIKCVQTFFDIILNIYSWWTYFYFLYVA